ARLEKANALEIKKSFDYVVTDLPYGRSTGKIADLEKFYSDFLEVLEKILNKKALIIFPNYVDWKKLVKKTSLKLIQHFNFYIHKSLSKEILVLEKP
ncbi:hypothetical protein KY339_02250, partial [Candidatus Woesearchaeota archaeon]|nr:hypothetical protein [Candidatus Woesearchaeota archaeon]